MRFSAVATAAALVGVVSAGQLFRVEVGKTNLTFEPEFINAKQGDTIMFVFHPKNHTVTQSSFAQPCENYTKGGLDSGFIAYDPKAELKTLKAWNVTLNDEKPKWFTCRQKVDDSTTHCSKGMVFSVNPDKGKKADGTATSADAFKKLALASKPNVAAVDGQASGSASSASSSGSASATGSASKSDATSASGSLSASDSKTASGSGPSSGTASASSSGSASASSSASAAGTSSSAAQSDAGKPALPTSSSSTPASATSASSSPSTSPSNAAGALSRNTMGAVSAAGFVMAFLL